MLPALVATFAGTGPAERNYRLMLRASPKTSVALHARTPAGWIAAFCTASVCAPGHVVVHIPQSGRSFITFHVYRVQDDAARAGRVVVTDDRGKPVALAVSF